MAMTGDETRSETSREQTSTAGEDVSGYFTPLTAGRTTTNRFEYPYFGPPPPTPIPDGMANAIRRLLGGTGQQSDQQQRIDDFLRGLG
jgi:hypothetical protein